MDRADEQGDLHECYVIAVVEATTPLQQGGQEFTLELLIEAAALLKECLLEKSEELGEDGD